MNERLKQLFYRLVRDYPDVDLANQVATTSHESAVYSLPSIAAFAAEMAEEFTPPSSEAGLGRTEMKPILDPMNPKNIEDVPDGLEWLNVPVIVKSEDWSYEATCLLSFPKSNGKIRYIVEDNGRLFVQRKEQLTWLNGDVVPGIILDEMDNEAASRETMAQLKSRHTIKWGPQLKCNGINAPPNVTGRRLKLYYRRGDVFLDLFTIMERMTFSGDINRLDFNHTSQVWKKKLQYTHFQPDHVPVDHPPEKRDFPPEKHDG